MLTSKIWLLLAVACLSACVLNQEKPYPSQWFATSNNSSQCADFSGIYFDAGEYQSKNKSSLLKLLGAEDVQAEKVTISCGANQTLRIYASNKGGNPVLVTEAAPYTLENGVLQIEASFKPIHHRTHDTAADGFIKKRVALLKSGSYLIVNTSGTFVGAAMLIPVIMNDNDWARFSYAK